MKTYTTVQGDTWDLIAHKKLGGTKYTDLLIKENLEYRETFLFPAGVKLRLPELGERVNTSMPPWKR